MEAENAEAICDNLENNFDSTPKQPWQESLGEIISEEEDKEIQASEDQLLHTGAELDETDRLKAGDKQEFRRFEAEQEAARIMVFE